MGDPKKPRKTYSKPKSPWRSDQLAQELYLLGTYGLRNKRELWKSQTQLSNVRKQARRLLAASQEVRLREESKLLDSLKRRGLVGEGVALDDVLTLSVEDVLGRRLQTVVFRKGFAVSPAHARHLITHGHVKIGDRKVTIPSYPVPGREEGLIQLFARERKEKPKSETPAAKPESPAAKAETPAPSPEPAAAK